MQHVLTLDHLTPAALRALLSRAALEKRRRFALPAGTYPLRGRTVALLFEKPSLRTRVSFEVAARELGAESLYLSPQEVGLGTRESVADVARVLSTYVQAIVLRTFRHETLEEFAGAASVPVINGLTDRHHPCQGLADALTLCEAFGDPAGRVLAYIGDGNNVAHSLAQAAVALGMHVRLATPVGYGPDPRIMEAAAAVARTTGGSLRLLTDPAEAARGADALATDVWTSMGQEAEAATRRAVFHGYCVDERLLARAAPHAIVLHPLPAHRGEEITAQVLDGPHARVLAEAENRLHVQKALLYALLADEDGAWQAAHAEGVAHADVAAALR